MPVTSFIRFAALEAASPVDRTAMGELARDLEQRAHEVAEYVAWGAWSSPSRQSAYSNRSPAIATRLPLYLGVNTSNQQWSSSILAGYMSATLWRSTGRVGWRSSAVVPVPDTHCSSTGSGAPASPCRVAGHEVASDSLEPSLRDLAEAATKPSGPQCVPARHPTVADRFGSSRRFRRRRHPDSRLRRFPPPALWRHGLRPDRRGRRGTRQHQPGPPPTEQPVQGPAGAYLGKASARTASVSKSPPGPGSGSSASSAVRAASR